jgi:NAD(P)H-hydrate epimerase
MPARAPNAHKGNFGHVLAIGGDLGLGGAIRLAGEAALRVGAGLVSVATRGEHVGALNAARPELMATGVDGPQELETLLQRASVIALGPGLGQRAWGHALWHTAIAAGKPVVLDADGLNLLARDPLSLPPNTVLTPHPGEAARLLEAIRGDRCRSLAAVRDCAAPPVRLRAQGRGHARGLAARRSAVCPWGNPGMASGGMGDVSRASSLACSRRDSMPIARLHRRCVACARGDVARAKARADCRQRSVRPLRACATAGAR